MRAYESDVEGQGANVQHCVNTAWTWAGIDFAKWVAWKRAHPEAHRALFKRGHEELGYLETPHAGWRDDVGLFMGPRLTGYSGLKVADLTAVEIESRRRMTAHLEFFRRHAPGLRGRVADALRAPSSACATRAGSIGTHKMVMDEWREAVRHDDEIGVSPSPSAKFANISVPYGCIVPAELDNVLVGGRHVATDPQTQAFMREIPQCWLTGQAAGVAAALSAGSGTAPRALDVRELQHELRGQGVYLQTAGAPGRGMTYVIGSACIGTTDRSCVDVCPVDCIHEVAQMLVIDPGECIDCSLCEPACPVSAITPAEGVAPDDRAFIEINAAWPDGPEAVDELVAAYQAQ